MAYVIESKQGEKWAAYNADVCEFLPTLPDASIDFSVYSPPFSNIFVYSNSDRDMGNCANDDEFFEHYGFVINEMFRVTKPGRLSAVHCSELPMKKSVDGDIGLKDFPGAIIRAHEAAGWILASRITIWRCPVVEMTRTKALGLLYKQLKKDSSMSRAGLSDTLLVFRKPGVNVEPITHTPEDFPVRQWQEWASPVWLTINQTNVLNKAMARDHDDERHICPLQLDLIERAVTLWSNRGDVVLSPFAGIGSEGVVSLKLGRKFVGCELKPSYFNQQVKYLEEAELAASIPKLFDKVPA